MQSNEARKFEVMPGGGEPQNGTEKMRTTLSSELRNIEARKVTSLEQGSQKRREITRVRKMLEKLTEPARNINEIKKETLDASPKAIGELKGARKELSDKRVTQTKLPWWKKAVNFFSGKKEDDSDLELTQARKAVQNSQKAQSELAYEVGKDRQSRPTLVPDLTPAESAPQIIVPEQGEDDSETIETEAIR